MNATPEFSKGYGWRARIGMLNPGAVAEASTAQFYRMAPDGVTLASISLGLRRLTVEDVEQALVGVEEAARELGRHKVSCVLLGASSSVFVGGVGSDVRLIRLIEESAGVPASTAQTAAIEAMRSLNMNKIALATPFPDTFNRMLSDFLQKSGFVVRSVLGAGVEYSDLMSAPARIAYDLAGKVVAQAGDIDGLYIPGAPFPVVDVIERLEAELGIPVVTSLQATLWKGLALSRASRPFVPGFGRLLQSDARVG